MLQLARELKLAREARQGLSASPAAEIVQKHARDALSLPSEKPAL